MAGRRKKAQPDVNLSSGTLLSSVSSGKKWVLSEKVGVGGFGVVFAAFEEGQRSGEAAFVAKIEPKSNGALFGEINTMRRVLIPKYIEQWKQTKSLSFLGIAPFLDFGTIGNDHRFLITERYGVDIDTLFEKAGRSFPRDRIVNIGVKVVDVLEFLHSGTGYVHLDIKGANLMQGRVNKDEVYLADLGLAREFKNKNGDHVEDRPDKRYAHNGTREFTSRDSHRGVPSRRADIETLGYNLVYWEGGNLPWAQKQNNDDVHAAKCSGFQDVRKLLGTCFHGRAPKYLEKFFEILAKLGFYEEPNYQELKRVLQEGFGCGNARDQLADENTPTLNNPRRRLQKSTPLTPVNPPAEKKKAEPRLRKGLTPAMLDMLEKHPSLKHKYFEEDPDDESDSRPRSRVVR